MSRDRIAGAGGLGFGVLLFWLAGESEAYLFPRITAILIAMLGAVILIATLLPASRSMPDAESPGINWLRILPLLVMLVIYRWAMEIVGFYSAGFVTFLAIVWIYAPEPFSVRVAARRIVVSGCFMAAIFAIFFLLLRVQTPRGILI